MMEKATPRGTWKSRFGLGRRSSQKNKLLNAMAADAAVAGAPPLEPDHGAGRTLFGGAGAGAAATNRGTPRNNNNKGNKSNAGKRGTSSSFMQKLHIKTEFRKESRDASDTSNPQSPNHSNNDHDSYLSIESDLEENNKLFGEDLRNITDPRLLKEAQDRKNQEMIYHKQRLKERDGFCRRVDSYDGNVIVVDQKPTYEIGNYLGGGVAGVVYQGHRLRPLKEYPVRVGINDDPTTVREDTAAAAADAEEDGVAFYCGPVDFEGALMGDQDFCGEDDGGDREDPSVLSPMSTVVENTKTTVVTTTNGTRSSSTNKGGTFQEEADVAIETTMTANENGDVVMLDAQDAPSRSKHFSRAAGVKIQNNNSTTRGSSGGAASSSRGKSLNHGLTDEAVAVKILNPVGYRILQSDGMKGTVVVKRGDPMDSDVKRGRKPMTDKHVWWMVNPNSRNLRTLQRYNGKDKTSSASKSVQVDRGAKDRGLRLSLIAAYLDPRTNQLRELTLTRCLEIWGHVPFNATDSEFDDMMTAIERVNAGQGGGPTIQAYDTTDEGDDTRTGTDAETTTNNNNNSVNSDGDPMSPVAFQAARTGLLRAALSPRQTVYCQELEAFIAIPAVPTKYLRWLKQRRAATKEVRNMMLIGRHKNVLHLFEVLEYIEESKSTMFLILELVKGGELFDLISSSAGNKNRQRSEDSDESERLMRQFFFELSSGINYCHKNGIAHRDLKPENLLVHNSADGKPMLKIADFGLSASFLPTSRNQASDNDTLLDSPRSPLSMMDGDSAFSPKTDGGFSPTSQASGNSVKETMDKMIASGANALSFLTCGAMEGVLCIPTGDALNGPSVLRRMTSVVGSPHYVAPEIISQSEDKNGKRSRKGYDGAKADVWSAGVILYAMLFRSLPFGEDLLRCPRYQSYRKWYDEVRELGGRRSSSTAALTDLISGADERDALGPHWFFPAATSKESRDLIVAMLNPKPEDRLSVEQVLEHPWIKNMASSSTATTQ